MKKRRANNEALLAYFWISTTFATGTFFLTDSIPFLQAFQL